MPQGIVSRSPVATARSWPRSSATSVLRTTSTASTLPSPRIATGETRKRRNSLRGLPSGSRAAYSRSRSTLRRAVERSSASAASLAGSSSRSAGSTITSAPASSPSSFSSGFVNAACAGPRRPSITISLQAGADDRVRSRPASCRSGASSSCVSESIRATSTATFPFPTTTARSPERSNDMLLEVGVAVVPGDEHRRGPRAGQVLAGDVHPPVGLRADRVDDRVVERVQLGRADLRARRRRCRRTGSPGSFAIFSKTRETALISGWSGATPRRTSPHGVGSRSIMSTIAPRASSGAAV